MKEKVEYHNGYRVTFTYGDKDLGEIIKGWVLRDLDNEMIGEYNNNTKLINKGDKNGKDE